jgi:hypothetical protein
MISDPQTLNRYAYVRNNPLHYIDPFGLADIPVTCGNGQQVGSCQTGTANCTLTSSCSNDSTPLPVASGSATEIDLSGGTSPQEAASTQSTAVSMPVPSSYDVPINGFAQQGF